MFYLESFVFHPFPLLEATITTTYATKEFQFQFCETTSPKGGRDRTPSVEKSSAAVQLERAASGKTCDAAEALPSRSATLPIVVVSSSCFDVCASCCQARFSIYIFSYSLSRVRLCGSPKTLNISMTSLVHSLTKSKNLCLLFHYSYPHLSLSEHESSLIAVHKPIKNEEKTDSERSDECIDFTMLCLVHWGGHFLNFPIVFKSAGKNQKKIKKKREFLRKTSFRPNRFFYMVVIQKLITFKFLRNLSKTIKNTTLSWRFLYFLISSSYIPILTKIRQNHEYLQIIFILAYINVTAVYNVNESSILYFTFRWRWSRQDNEAKTYQIFSRQNGRTRHDAAARPFPLSKTLSPLLRHLQIYTCNRRRTFYDPSILFNPSTLPSSFYVRRRNNSQCWYSAGGSVADRQDPSLFGWLGVGGA
ncbi:Uncharacterized protein FWK35_00015417 [Aphis craccivora]|uniref:Uncharacterized protein n=1 Tax=Aphis craccivora TaxID=307492 RepID=A0A6G0W4T6_APHCR|nr:Uncharacterized protein FWK35_00015417 [Aphis craccivora]